MHRSAKSLVAYALSLPEAWEDHPWGETVVKVGKKIFLFAGETTITLKLPVSANYALTAAGAEPTGYGLGKSGWVTLVAGKALPPLGVLRDWVDESYCAVAPKKFAARLTSKPV